MFCGFVLMHSMQHTKLVHDVHSIACWTWWLWPLSVLATGTCLDRLGILLIWHRIFSIVEPPGHPSNTAPGTLALRLQRTTTCCLHQPIFFFLAQLETHRRNKSRKLDLDYRWISSDWCFTSHWDTNRSEHSVGRWLDDNSGYLYSRWSAYGLQMCCFFSVRQGHSCSLTAHQLTNLFFIRTVFTDDEKIILKMKYSRNLCKFRGSFLRFVDAHQVQGGMRTSVE